MTVHVPPYATGKRRWLFKALGWSSVGMAVVGAITPGIPTVPFVILAGYFFVRSSPEAHQWLRESRFGPMLKDWEEHRGVSRSVKVATTALVATSMALTVVAPIPVPAKVAVVGMQVVIVVVVLRLPTVVRPLALPAAQ